MRIRYWSSDVCSSDLPRSMTASRSSSTASCPSSLSGLGSAASNRSARSSAWSMMSCALLGMVLTSLEELRSGWHGVNDAGLCFVAGDDADLEEGAGRVGADEPHEAIVEVVVADGVGGGVANVGDRKSTL